MLPKTAIPDANFLLHCRPLADLDWPALLKCDVVTIVILPQVTRELDDKKVDRSSRVRERAQSAIKQLRSILGDAGHGKISDRVRVRAEPNEPTIDFAANSLAREIPDDRIMAGAIQLKNESAENIVLATRDFGLALRARQRGFEVFEPPSDCQKPDEPTDEEKEIRRLQRELHRRPDLDIKFASGERKLEKALRRIPALTESELARIVEIEAKRQFPTEPVELSYGAQMVTRMNEKRAEYYHQYRAYAQERHAHEQTMARTVELSFVLENNGNAVANDIDVILTAESGPGTIAFEEDSRLLKAPKAPRHPGISELFADTPFLLPKFPLDERRPFIFLADTRQEGGFRGTTETIKLKHRMHQRLGAIYVAFEKDARSFPVHYRINCEELPSEIEGDLHVIVRDEG